jgi:hypothetical protein
MSERCFYVAANRFDVAANRFRICRIAMIARVLAASVLALALSGCEQLPDETRPPTELVAAWQDTTTECVALQSPNSGSNYSCTEVAMVSGQRLFCGSAEWGFGFTLLDLTTGQTADDGQANSRLQPLLEPLAASLSSRLGASIYLQFSGLMGVASDPRPDTSTGLFTMWSVTQSVNNSDTAKTRWLLLVQFQPDSMAIQSQVLIPLPRSCAPRSTNTDSLKCLAASDGQKILVATTPFQNSWYTGNQSPPALPVTIWEVSDTSLTAPVATGLEIGGELRAFSYTSEGWQLVADQRGGDQSGTVVTLLDSSLNPQATQRFLYGTNNSNNGSNEGSGMGDWIETAEGEQWFYVNRNSSSDGSISTGSGEGFLCRDIEAFFGEVTP